MAASWHGHQTFLTATHKNQPTLSKYTTCERLTEGQMDTEIDNQQLWLKTEHTGPRNPRRPVRTYCLSPITVPSGCCGCTCWKQSYLMMKYWYRNLEMWFVRAFINFLQVNCESLVWVLISNLFMLLLMIQVEEFEKSFIGWAWFIIITITGKPYDWNLHKVLTTYSYCLPLTWISCS